MNHVYRKAETLGKILLYRSERDHHLSVRLSEQKRQ